MGRTALGCLSPTERSPAKKEDGLVAGEREGAVKMLHKPPPGRGGSPRNASGRVLTYRRAGSLAFLLAVSALCVSLTPARSYAKGCYAYDLIDYNRGRLYAQYLIDLPACWDDGGDYNVRAKIVRQIGPGTEIVKKEKSCDSDDLCRIPIVMKHAEVEIAQYTVSLRYQVAKNTSVTQRKELVCLSASVFEARCEEL